MVFQVDTQYSTMKLEYTQKRNSGIEKYFEIQSLESERKKNIINLKKDNRGLLKITLNLMQLFLQINPSNLFHFNRN